MPATRSTRSVFSAELDCGNAGPERRLYIRELVARFGYELALNWNLGEENTQTTVQQRAMIQYIHDVDPYDPPGSPDEDWLVVVRR